MRYLIQTKTDLLTIFDSKDIKNLVKDVNNYFNGKSNIIDKAIDKCDTIKEAVALYNEIARDLDCRIKSIYELDDPIV